MNCWVTNGTKETLRDDYNELATLALLFLGGATNDNEQTAAIIYTPGALNRARWMAKCIYTIKIALFRAQLMELKIYTASKLTQIDHLAIFLSLFYAPAWLMCTSSVEAPNNDLMPIKLLEKTEFSISRNATKWPEGFALFVSKSREKFLNHAWYLSERLVMLSLFSNHVPTSEKQKMVRSLMAYKIDDPKNSQLMLFYEIFQSKSLKDFIGKTNWTIFNLLNIDTEFLKIPVSRWDATYRYCNAKKMQKNLSVNDAVNVCLFFCYSLQSQVLGLATELNNKTAPRNEEQLQAMSKLLKAHEGSCIA